MKVAVYFNLHKKLWSIKALEGPSKGKVIYHDDRVDLTNVEFKVQKSGRARVLREGRKNVHAFVIGNVTPCLFHIDNAEPVRYNPYIAGHFYSLQDGRTVNKSAKATLIKGKGVFIQ